MAAAMQLSPALRAERPRALFASTLPERLQALRPYDITPDGKRLIMVLSPRTVELPTLPVVTSWQRRLRK